MGKLKKVVSIIILIILIPILFVNGVILVNSFIHPDEIPSFFGWKPFIVLSGSMETEIDAGDVAVVRETDTASLKKGDIILMHNGTKHTADSLELLIKNIQSKGLEIKKVSDILYKENYKINENGTQVINNSLQ